MPQIRLIFRPGGPDCNHVHITDVSGNHLRTALISELRESAADGNRDDYLIAQIKRLARKSGLIGSALKIYLETEDFDL